MIFLYPKLLWLIILPLALFVFLQGSKKKSLKAIFSDEIYKKLTQNRQSLAPSIRLGLLSLALSFMIVALAQPVIEKEKIKINQKAIDVIAAMDISRSMEAKDLFPNRLEWAKRKLLKFIDLTQTIRVGVMAFAQNAYVVTPITEDKDVASYLVDNLDTHGITENGTNLLQLLDASNKQLESALHKYVLIMSDGGDTKDFDKEIEFAKDNHLTVFVLAVGTEKGAPIEDQAGSFLKKNNKIILTQLNTKMKDLALQTGGVYIQSSIADADIQAMLNEIKKIAEAKTVASKEIRSFVEYFHYFLAVAALLLLFALHSFPRRGVNLVIACLALSFPLPSQAGVTDFQTINKAKNAYESKDFQGAQKEFKTLSKETPSNEAYYNLGNSFYKQKNYKKAIENYSKVTDDASFKSKALYNQGNAHAFASEFEAAKKAYEASLKLKDDDEAKKNLEEVKRLIRKNRKEDPNGNKKMNKDDPKGKKKGQKKDPKGKNKSLTKDKKQEGKQKEKKESDKKKPSKEKSKKKKASAKDQGKAKTKKEQVAKPRSQKDLTDKEEKKLMQQLQMKKGSSFRYKIPSKFEQENHHDQPW